MLVKGMMNSEKYTDVLTKKVTLEMARRFPEGLGVFQQDLAPCHTSRKVKNVFALKNISVLDWPRTSLDYNPIENLWSIIKLQLRRKVCTTVAKLIEAIIECWYRDLQTQDTYKKLVDSMTKRVKMID